MSKLVISTDSWHYSYYCWIRSMYGCHNAKPTSLCPYFQTMLWGSIFCALFCIPMIVGWFLMKAGRYLYKSLDSNISNAIFQWLDKSTPLVKMYDQGPDEFSDNPLLTGVTFCFLSLALLTVVSSPFVGLIFGTIYIFEIFNFLIDTVLTFGHWVFGAITFIGYLVSLILKASYWFFTNGPLWITILSWVVFFIKWLIIMGVGSLAVCLTLIGIYKLSFVRNLIDSFNHRFNGYSEAREKRKRDMEVLREARERSLPKWECEYCSYKNLATHDRCDSCCTKKPVKPTKLGLWFNSVYAKLFGDTVPRPPRNTNVLWEYVKAFKQGICPLVSFASPEELRNEAIKRATLQNEHNEKAS